jgi:hypothetical protein
MIDPKKITTFEEAMWWNPIVHRHMEHYLHGNSDAQLVPVLKEIITELANSDYQIRQQMIDATNRMTNNLVKPEEVRRWWGLDE